MSRCDFEEGPRGAEAVDCAGWWRYTFLGVSDHELCGGVRVVPVDGAGRGLWLLCSGVFCGGQPWLGVLLALCLLVWLLWVWSVGLSVVWSLIAVAEFLYLFFFGEIFMVGAQRQVLWDPAQDVSWGRGIGVLLLWLGSALLAGLQTGFGAIVLGDLEQLAFLARAVCHGQFWIRGQGCWLVPSMGIVLMFLWGLWLGLSRDVCFFRPVICGFCLVMLSLRSCRGAQGWTVAP